jgi:hypothetical protein
MIYVSGSESLSISDFEQQELSIAISSAIILFSDKPFLLFPSLI